MGLVRGLPLKRPQGRPLGWGEESDVRGGGDSETEQRQRHRKRNAEREQRVGGGLRKKAWEPEVMRNRRGERDTHRDAKKPTRRQCQRHTRDGGNQRGRGQRHGHRDSDASLQLHREGEGT